MDQMIKRLVLIKNLHRHKIRQTPSLSRRLRVDKSPHVRCFIRTLHVLLIMASGESEFSGFQGSFVSDGRTDEHRADPEMFTCERHSSLAAVKFCSDHEAAVCSQCASYFHRSCKEVETIEELAKQEVKEKKFKKFLADLDVIVQKITKLKRMKNEELAKLRADTNAALTELTEFRRQINWFLDKLEKKGKSFIEKRYKELHSGISSDADLCDNTLADLEQMKKRLDNLEDKSQRLMNMKLGSSKLTTAHDLYREMRDGRPRPEFIKMTVDPTIERFVMNLRWYGKHRTYLSMEAPPSLPHLYKVKYDAQYDVRAKGDKSVCYITDACQIKNGTILLVDSANHNIKQLDVTYKMVDSHPLEATPVAVCTLPDGAAVLLENETGSSVRSVKTSQTSIKLGESFQIPAKCTGLDFLGDVYFISTNTSILTYSITGEFLHEIHEDTSGNFGHLCVNSDGTRLYVTDSKRGLVIMGTDGGHVELVEDPAIKVASGVCCDRSGQVFLSGHASHNVVQLGKDGGKLGELLDQKKFIKYPLSMCYDSVGKRLVTCQKTMNVIKVYQLK